jgi:hypothetical protein
MAKVDLRLFNHLKAAEIETKMWRSYYNHQFIKMFYQLTLFMRSVLRCGWFIALRLAWHSAIAAVYFRRRRGRENYDKVLKHLIKFYKIGSNHSIAPYDYKKAGQLELEWWDIHRYPKKYKKSLEQSLAEAFAVIYHCEPKNLKEYAYYRAKAAQMLTHEGDTHPTKNDWPKIEDLLYKTWHSLSVAVRP